MEASNPGYMVLPPRSSPLLGQGDEQDEEDDTCRRLFSEEAFDDAELAREAASQATELPRRRDRWVGQRTAAACAGLALIGLLAGTASYWARRGDASLQRSGHLSGATRLAEDSTAAPWLPRGLVIPPEAGSLPKPEWPETPSPAPLPTLATLAPLPTLAPAPAVVKAPVLVTLAPPELPGLEVPKLEVPKVELPDVEVPKVELPDVEVPKVELPDLEVPKVEAPKLDVPKVDVPELPSTPSWGDALRISSGEESTTAAVPTTPPDICNREAEIPEQISKLRTWVLPNITKDVCYRMFSDQVKMTNHGRDTFDRNFCWVMMKRYGCLNHLNDKYTWAQAQDTVSSLGGVPPPSTSKFEPLEEPELCDRLQSSDSHNWTKSENENASKWFQENVAVYVLNLDSQKERWHNISKRLQELQILSDRVPGFNMSKKKDLSDAYHEGAIPMEFNMSLAQEQARLPKNGMGGITGTVGCAAGHFRALQRASLSASRRPITLILEDDANPDDDFIPQVWSLVREELPCQWDAVSLGSRCPFGKCISRRLSRVQPDGNEPEWRCRHGVNYGFQGVLYRTEAMGDLMAKWKPVVFDESRPHCLDVDVALAAISDQVGFYAVPSLQALLTEQQEVGGSVRVLINGGHV